MKTVGIDEAGRGSLFGRMFVGAVILRDGIELDRNLIKDSKKFSSRKKREIAYQYVLDNSQTVSVASVTANQIDQMGISSALISAMHSSIDNCDICPDFIRVDGTLFSPYHRENQSHLDIIPYSCEPSADQNYLEVAAASIVAKVNHDRYILNLVEANPDLKKWGIDKNMGYGSKIHLDMIKTNGITTLHRKSFKCSQNCLEILKIDDDWKDIFII